MVLVIIDQARHLHISWLVDLCQKVGFVRVGIVVLADVAITVLPTN